MKKISALVASSAAVCALAIGVMTPAQAITNTDLPGVVSDYTDLGAPTGGEKPIKDSHTEANMVAFNYRYTPVGTNDWNCKSDKNPIVLIAGTSSNFYDDWAKMGPALVKDGYCVFGFNHNPAKVAGVVYNSKQFSGDIRDSAFVLGVFVDRVLAATGKSKVTLIGHSQGGGALPVYYLNRLGGAAKVSHLIGLAPSNHGTTMNGSFKNTTREQADAMTNGILRDWNAQGLPQQIASGSFIQDLYYEHGPVAQAGVAYSVIASSTDQTVTPFTNSFINEENVRNIQVQNVYPDLNTDHANFTYYNEIISMVKAELAAPPAPATGRG